MTGSKRIVRQGRSFSGLAVKISPGTISTASPPSLRAFCAAMAVRRLAFSGLETYSQNTLYCEYSGR